jgi:hypothetical protein
MQSLGTPLLEDEQPLFEMLNNQSFTLNVDFINSDFTAYELHVFQVVGSTLLELPRITNESDGLLQVSTNLTSHSRTIAFNLSSNSALGGFRVGLTGPAMKNMNYVVQELHFASSFNYSGRTVTQDPSITIQLIKLINETEGLSSTDDTQYSALWIPTFIINNDQVFYTEDDFQLYHILDNTILTVQVTEATYYIYNKQEPIAKVSKVIFTDILFTTMCIELFGLTFLVFKLGILPGIEAIINLCFGSKKVIPKGNMGGGCSYCRPIDPETLPAYRVPLQRSLQDIPMHPVQRQTSEIIKLHHVATPADVFN